MPSIWNIYHISLWIFSCWGGWGRKNLIDGLWRPPCWFAAVPPEKREDNDLGLFTQTRLKECGTSGLGTLKCCGVSGQVPCWTSRWSRSQMFVKPKGWKRWNTPGNTCFFQLWVDIICIYIYISLARYITSSARTSRGRKFPKGKELYSTERICL